MKKIMTLVSAVMMALTANAKNIETEPFVGVRVDVPSKVRVVRGDFYSINIQAKDSLVENSINTTVKNGVLSVNTRDLAAFSADSKVSIVIIAPEDVRINAGRDMEVKERTNCMAKASDDLAMAK